MPIFFEEHLARLVQGIAALGLDRAIDKHELAEQVCRLCEANGGDHNSCRLLVTAGAPDGRPSCSSRPIGATSRSGRCAWSRTAACGSAPSTRR